MNTRKVLGAATVAAVLLGGLAIAQGRSSGDGEVSPKQLERAKQYATWKVDDALDGVKADRQQRQAIHAVKDGLIEEGLALRGARDAVRQELVTQWRSETPDANTAHAAVDRMLDEVRGFAHKVVDAGLKVHQTLRPEQREQLYQRMEERRGRWHR